MDPRCVKAGEGDFNRYMHKPILLMTVIIIINLNNCYYYYYYYYFTYIYIFFPIKTIYSNKDNIVQDNKVHRRHLSSVMTTRVQKMTHALMYVYFNPSCSKGVEGGLQELTYKLIILIITRTTAK